MANLKDKKIEFIVETALELFTQKSIEDVTMVDIARELDIGEATLYRYFRKKENLVLQASISLWRKLKEKFSIYLEPCQDFLGLKQVHQFYKCFLKIYKDTPSIFLFINDFDNYVISKGIQKQDMEEVEREILSIKQIYDSLFIKGIEDGSIKDKVDESSFYFTTNHALLSSCCKLSKKEILYSDEIVKGEEQIKLLIDIFIQYIASK